MNAITTSQGGEYYTPDAIGLQSAIDDTFNAGGGTVWIWTTLSLNSTIYLKSQVHLDFNNNLAILVGGRGGAGLSNFVRIENCRFGTVENVRIVPAPAQTAPIFFILNSTSTPTMTEYNRLSKITIEAAYPALLTGIHPSHFHSGILIRASGGIVRRNIIENVTMAGVTDAIELQADDSDSTAIEDNQFYSIYANDFRSLVRFSPTSGSGLATISRNTFEHIRGLATRRTRVGLDGIIGKANHFDHISVELPLEKRRAPTKFVDATIEDSAVDTYICAHELRVVSNDGDNTIFDPPLAAFSIFEGL